MLSKRKAILLSGATGLLGARTAERLISEGYSPILLCRQPPNHVPKGTEVVVADISNRGFSSLIPQSVHGIIHLAQSRHYREFPEKASETFSVNLQATQELLDFGRRRGVETFVYASSGGIYESSRFRLAEDSPAQNSSNLDHYLATKLASELLVQSYRGLFTHLILRYFFIYGRGQRRSMLLPSIYDRVNLGEKIDLVGDGGLVINPVHVDDAARATVESLALRDSKIINVAGPQVLSLREISELFGEVLGRKPVFQSQEGREVRLLADVSSMTALLSPPSIILAEKIGDLAR